MTARRTFRDHSHRHRRRKGFGRATVIALAGRGAHVWRRPQCRLARGAA